MDLHKCATSDFGLRKRKRDSNFITITAHVFSACPQIYRALLILMAHPSQVRFPADNFSGSCVYHQRNRLLLGGLTPHLNVFFMRSPKKEEFYDFQNTVNQAQRN